MSDQSWDHTIPASRGRRKSMTNLAATHPSLSEVVEEMTLILAKLLVVAATAGILLEMMGA